jgi:hypothetical protein
MTKPMERWRASSQCPSASTFFGTFGGIGAGSNAFWVDPATSLVFVCLTAGLWCEAASLERFCHGSDLAHQAIET